MQIFEDKADRTQLLQGDLLVRSEALVESLKLGHGYYASATDYSHFLVLTQSCDLVRRKEGSCKARYITLCAARPLQLVVDRFLERISLDKDRLAFQICRKESEEAARQFIERIVHHGEDGYFFIPKSASSTVARDLCAFLPLSIALKSAEHYDVCLSAKVAQLKDVFQAKVGWLTGNQYSRVGTPDLQDLVENQSAYLKQLYHEALQQESIWIRKYDYDRLKPKLDELRNGDPGAQISPQQIESLVDELPSEAKEIAEKVVASLIKRGLLNPNDQNRAQNILSNDGPLKALLKQMTRTY